MRGDRWIRARRQVDERYEEREGDRETNKIKREERERVYGYAGVIGRG